MEIKATQKFTRQPSLKVRLVANTVKKMPLPQALQQLAIIERRSTLVLLKTIKQAIANAVNNHGLKFEDLEIASITVNGGPTYKRMRAASRGRGNEIKKRTSHIMVTLRTIEAAKAETVTASTPVIKNTIKPSTKTEKVKKA